MQLQPVRGQRCLGKRLPIRPEEANFAVAVVQQLDRESLLVDRPVVTPTQKDEIIEPGRTTVGPVAHVVRIAVAAAAPGEAASVPAGH